MLTPKQQRFCAEYLIDLNATAAYKRAGYACKNDNTAAASSCMLLRNPKIQAEIAKGRAEQEHRTVVTADYVIGNLRAVVERCMGAGKQFNAGGAVAALDKLAKHLGLYAPDRVTVDGSVSHEHKHEHVITSRAKRYAGLFDELAAGEAPVPGDPHRNGSGKPLDT
jgi:phage terminase small subunit